MEIFLNNEPVQFELNGSESVKDVTAALFQWLEQGSGRIDSFLIDGEPLDGIFDRIKDAPHSKIEKIEKITLSAKAGESGKLFGTITTKKLSEELLNKTGMEIDKKSIILDSPINHIGNFVMTIKLSSKVKAQLNVEVSASETIKEVYEEEEKSEEA